MNELITKRFTMAEILPKIADELVKNYGLNIEDVQLVRKGIIASDLQVQDDERAIISYLTTAALDRDGEIMLPQGGMLDMYRKHPIVLWCHQYNTLPLGKNVWIKSDEKGLIGKTIYADHEEAEKVYQYRKGGFPLAESIGFAPVSWIEGPAIQKVDKLAMKIPADVDLSSVKRIYDKWILVEYSDCPVPSNPEALEVAKQKGLVIPVGGMPGPEQAKAEEEPIPTPAPAPVTKMADLQGRPSTWDILDAIYAKLRPLNDYEKGIWYGVRDLYPFDYPNGTVVIYKDSSGGTETYLYDYIYADGVVALGNAVELEMQYAVKSTSGIMEAIAQHYGEKAGRVLSEKNRALISECVSSMGSASVMLQELLDATEPESEKAIEKFIDLDGLHIKADQNINTDIAITKADIESAVSKHMGGMSATMTEIMKSTIQTELKKLTGKIK